ncbi:hypothetical protein HMPREF3053_09900 [Corynebacterium sp. HMSC064E07]|uniref:hypothetical protein n=1 Tax=Corynebacterium sp. HMSC064E07 TaxID=1739545 RepID=UPI0008A161FF|nr:hypothetical protein [Corynebacterium sp. HMSC064E07]OFO26452.1 hypothetical protein HMPREF3053_09900 [Corynebacterium sp. HMSC064E07]
MNTTVSDNAPVVCTIDDPAAHGEQVKATARELIAAGFRVMLIEAPQSLDTPQQHRLAKVGAEKKPGEPITWRSNTGTDDLELIRRGVELRGGYVNLAAVPTRLSAIGDIDGGVERETLLEALGLDESALYETTPGSQQYVNEKGKLCEAHDRGAHILIRFDESDEELLEAKDALGTSWSWDSGTGVKVLFRSQEGGYALTYPTVRANGQFDDGQYIRTGRVIGCPPALRAYIMEVGGAALERKRAAEQKKSEAQNTSVLVEEMDADTTPRGFGRVGWGYGDNNAAFVAAWEMEHTVADVLADERIPEDWRFTDAGTDSNGTQQWTAPGVHASDRSAVTGFSDTTGNELLNIFSPNVPDDVVDAFYKATEGKKPYDAGQSYGAWQLACALIYRGDWQAALVGEGMEIPRFPKEKYYGAILHADKTLAENSHWLQTLRRIYLQAAGFEWAADYPAPTRYIDAVTVDGATTVYVETTVAGSTEHEELTVATGEEVAETPADTTEEVATLYAIQLDQPSGFLTMDMGTGALTAAPAATELPPAESPETVTAATSTQPPAAVGQPQAQTQVQTQPQPQAQVVEEQPQEATHERLLREVEEALDEWVPEIEASLGRALTPEQRDALGHAFYPSFRRERRDQTELFTVVGAPGADRGRRYPHGSPVDPAVVTALFNYSEITRGLYWTHVDTQSPGTPLGMLVNVLLATARRIDTHTSASPFGIVRQPLSMFTVCVGRSGMGKSSSNALPPGIAFAAPGHAGPIAGSTDNLPNYDGDVKVITPKGLGMHMCDEVEGEEGGKKTVLRHKAHPVARIKSDELSGFLTQLAKQPAGGLAMLAEAFSGENFVPASAQNGLMVAPDNYTVTLEANVQPKMASQLLESSKLGLLQRFVFYPAAWPWASVFDERDIARPQKPLQEQERITLPVVGKSFTWCPEMIAEYHSQREMQGAEIVPDWVEDRAHEFVLCFRVACLCAALHGRAEVTSGDWEWSRLLVRVVSSRTLDGLRADAREQKKQDHREVGVGRAYEKLGAEEELAAQRLSTMREVLDRLVEELDRKEGKAVTESQVTRRFSRGRHPAVKEALATLVEMGKLHMEVTMGPRPGKAYTLLDTQL